MEKRFYILSKAKGQMQKSCDFIVTEIFRYANSGKEKEIIITPKRSLFSFDDGRTVDLQMLGEIISISLQPFTGDEIEALVPDLKKKRFVYIPTKDKKGDKMEDQKTETQEMGKKSVRTQFYKDADRFGIGTAAATEEEFIEDFAKFFSQTIDSGYYQGDHEFQLNGWLPKLIEICCRFRGYKADVSEQRVIVCGDINFPVNLIEGEVTNRKEVVMSKSV